jgi:hypothetical protein
MARYADWPLDAHFSCCCKPKAQLTSSFNTYVAQLLHVDACRRPKMLTFLPESYFGQPLVGGMGLLSRTCPAGTATSTALVQWYLHTPACTVLLCCPPGDPQPDRTVKDFRPCMANSADASFLPNSFADRQLAGYRGTSTSRPGHLHQECRFYSKNSHRWVVHRVCL